MLRLKKYPKRSPYYYVRGAVAGERIFESTGTCERGQAEAYRIRRERETWQRRQLGIDARQPVSFAEAAIAYMEHTGQKRFMTPLIEHFKEKPIGEIGQAEFDAAAKALYPKVSPATRLRYVYTPLLAILNHAVSAKLAGAVTLKIERPRVERKPVDWATDDYLDALTPHCSPRLAALVQFMTETAVRVGEAIRLLPDDFTRSPGWAHVGKTKSGKPRMVPLSASMQLAVAAIMPAEPFARIFGYTSRWSVNNALRRAARRARLKYLSPHKIGRHAFAARLLGQGHTLKTVKEAGGWASLSVVDDNYGHLEQSHAHEAMLGAAQQRANRVQRKRKGD
jgi:integrase